MGARGDEYDLAWLGLMHWVQILFLQFLERDM
jgi:hypothetical protein